MVCRHISLIVQNFRVWLSNRILPDVVKMEQEDSAMLKLCRMEAHLHQYRENQMYLQDLLSQRRDEIARLNYKLQALRTPMKTILQKTTRELSATVFYDVRKGRDAKWEVVVGHCCLDGCDMDIVSFPSERDALLFAALLDAVNYHPPHNVACSACYAEYRKDCI